MPTSFLHPSASLPQPNRMRRLRTPASVRAAYARVRSHGNDARVTLSTSGPAAVIRPSAPGQISLLVERTSGDIELLWSGTAEPDETWAYPFPLDGVRSVLALWRSPDEPATNSVDALIRAATELPEQDVAFSSIGVQEEQASAEMLYRRRARVIILKAAWEAESASWELVENVGPALFDCREARRARAEGGDVHACGMAEVAIAESLRLGRPGGMLNPERKQGRLLLALEVWLAARDPRWGIDDGMVWKSYLTTLPANDTHGFQDALAVPGAAGMYVDLGSRLETYRVTFQPWRGSWRAFTESAGLVQLGWRTPNGCWAKPWLKMVPGMYAYLEGLPADAQLIARRGPLG